MLQRTLASSVHVTGVGLHSGERVSLTMHPADVDTGIFSSKPFFMMANLAYARDLSAFIFFIFLFIKNYYLVKKTISACLPSILNCTS